MGIFDRLRGAAPKEKEPERRSPETQARVRALSEYLDLAKKYGATKDFFEVAGAFGELIERTPADVLPASEEDLPYPKALVEAALFAVIGMTPGTREQAKAALVVHLQHFLPAGDIGAHAAALDAARAYHRTLARGDVQQAFEAAGYVGGALDRIAPLQRRVHAAQRRKEMEVHERFPEFWPDLPNYFLWQRSHVSDLVRAAKEGKALLDGIRGEAIPTDAETSHADWRTFEARLTEVAHLAKEAEQRAVEEEHRERHDAYAKFAGWLLLEMARLGAPADETAYTAARERFPAILAELEKLDANLGEATDRWLREQMRARTGSA